MRIVSGRWRGRRIEAPEGDLVRPTGDRVRESWMSIVHHLLPDARVVDLCAGSGALGLEALSRGAASCDFVEKSTRSISVIQANLMALGGHPAAIIHRDDAVRYTAALPAASFDIAFADPPYGTDIGAALVARWLDAPFAHVFGIEHASSVAMPAPGRTRRYGSTSLTFYYSDDS
ncbi:MAG: 16S rRNA (guanine(966)-N(2))-methyltransferase RsmD [Gemmatimonadota bacterium]